MISRYTQLCPIIFGCGALERLPEVLDEAGIHTPLIVTDQGVAASGILGRVEALLTKQDFHYTVYDAVQMDAPDYCCTQAAQLAEDAGIDGVIALGGGSCLDAGKAVSVLCTNRDQTITELITGTAYKKAPLPAVMIPTTSGTGSESTIFAVVSCSQDGRKRSVFTHAALGIVDPELTVGLPADITAYTGMDALAHAVEAYTSIRPNPHSDLLSLDAIRRITKWLPVACREPGNLEARENLALASNFAGIAFNNSATHIGHAIAHAVGAILHVPHGIACAWDTPEVLYLMGRYLPARARMIGQAMGLELPETLSGEQLGEALRDRVHQLMGQIGIPTCAELGISEEMLASCGDYAVTEKLRGLCGAPVTDDEVRMALANCARNYK